VLPALLLLLALQAPSNIVLIYTDARPDMYMSKDQLLPLVLYIDENGTALDRFFDTFLFLGLETPSNRSFEDGTATEEDIDWFSSRIITQIAELQAAAEEAEYLLGERVELNVIVAIPMPGSQDRAERIKSYIDYIISKFNFENLRLIGFYWTRESAPDDDVQLIRKICRYVHDRGLKMYWIPYFFAEVERWRDLGFDYAMLQPNFITGTMSLERFRKADEKMRKYNLSVEIELPTYTDNDYLEDWRQSFIIYLNASIFYGWRKLSPISYYYGNAFYEMYKEDRRYYDLLYRFVKGDLRLEEIWEEYREAVYQMRVSFIRMISFRLAVVVLLLLICIEIKRILSQNSI
jgi:uncharacterized protein YutD